jgi:hypothetical protein
MATSSACRHVPMMSLLVQFFSNEESTNLIPVPSMLASSRPVSWNRSSSLEVGALCDIEIDQNKLGVALSAVKRSDVLDEHQTGPSIVCQYSVSVVTLF